MVWIFAICILRSRTLQAAKAPWGKDGIAISSLFKSQSVKKKEINIHDTWYIWRHLISWSFEEIICYPTFLNECFDKERFACVLRSLYFWPPRSQLSPIDLVKNRFTFCFKSWNLRNWCGNGVWHQWVINLPKQNSKSNWANLTKTAQAPKYGTEEEESKLIQIKLSANIKKCLTSAKKLLIEA